MRHVNHSIPEENGKPNAPRFDRHDYKPEAPGFDIKLGDDLNILFKDDKGDYHSEYWPSFVEFKGNKVYQRDDLIDPARINPENGQTSIENMKKGNAPTGPDGKPINIHHLIQTEKGSLAEVTHRFHKAYSKIIHINPGSTESGINRQEFDKFRRSYWKERANDFIKGDQNEL
jgi:filamentous hemagglutinin